MWKKKSDKEIKQVRPKPPYFYYDTDRCVKDFESYFLVSENEK